MTTSPPRTDRYLWHRPQSRSIWFRMAVPKQYQDAVGAKIIQRSLNTMDKREAVIRAGKLRAELHDAWMGTPAIRPSNPYYPTDEDLLIAASDAAYVEFLARLDAHRASKNLSDPILYDAFLKQRRLAMLKYIATRDGASRRIWEGIADRRIESAMWLLPKEDERYSRFVSLIAENAIQALKLAIERDSGNLGAEPTSKAVVAGLKARADRAPAGEAILDLFDRYAEQRRDEGAKREDVLRQDRKVIELFAAFVGETRNITSIMPEDVRAFRDALRRLPPKWRVRKEFRGMSMREAAAKATDMTLPKVALTTVNKYLSTISPLFTWLIEERYDIKNPCDGLFHQRVKGKNPRPPFSTEQLNKMLGSPLFTGFLQDGAEHLPGNVRADDWRYWIPIICLFTGARIGEIAQIDVADVEQHERGMWFIHIRHDEASGQSTKSGLTRFAPVHTKLVALGFIKFVERQRRRAEGDGKSMLFPELGRNSRDQIGATPSRFWRDYLNDIGVKAGGDGFGSHSFRHTMADRLRDEGAWLNDQIRVVLGHNQKTVTSGYGTVREGTVPQLHEMIETVTFKGVNFDHLLPRAAA